MTTATKIVQMADSKATVKGTYYGVPFTGTVENSRQISCRPYPEEATIKLDDCFKLRGQKRDSLLIWSSDIDSRKHSLSLA